MCESIRVFKRNPTKITTAAFCLRIDNTTEGKGYWDRGTSQKRIHIICQLQRKGKRMRYKATTSKSTSSLSVSWKVKNSNNNPRQHTSIQQRVRNTAVFLYTSLSISIIRRRIKVEKAVYFPETLWLVAALVCTMYLKSLTALARSSVKSHSSAALCNVYRSRIPLAEMWLRWALSRHTDWRENDLSEYATYQFHFGSIRRTQKCGQATVNTRGIGFRIRV